MSKAKKTKRQKQYSQLHRYRSITELLNRDHKEGVHKNSKPALQQKGTDK